MTTRRYEELRETIEAAIRRQEAGKSEQAQMLLLKVIAQAMVDIAENINSIEANQPPLVE